MSFASASDAFADGPPSVSVSVQLAKVGNGYTIQLQTHPPMPSARPPGPTMFEGMDPDEMIDKMIDGIGALMRTIHDKGAGEDWKASEDRAQVREAFRVMFPPLANKADRAVVQYVPPRYDNLVFQSKKDLMDYLDRNL